MQCFNQVNIIFSSIVTTIQFYFRTTFNEFSSRHSKDERFRAVERIRDREAWFHDYIHELKTRGKEGSNRHSEKEKVSLPYVKTMIERFFL